MLRNGKSQSWNGLPADKVAAMLKELEDRQPQTDDERVAICRTHGFLLLPSGKLEWIGKGSNHA